MTLRFTLAAAALTIACAPAAVARDLTIASRTGLLQDAQQAVLLKPFTAVTGIAVQGAAREGGIDELRAHKDPGAGWDVVLLGGDELLGACDEGLLEKLDWSAVGGKDHYLPAAVSDCGLGSVAYSFVLAWDRDKFPAAPSWADFWDVAKYPGKRGLMRGPRTNLEIALLADGVAPGDVYRTLRTADGVERAFRKLDQIRPYAVWWESEQEAGRLLVSGEVLMTSATNAQIATTNRTQHRNFGMQWAGSLSAIDSWAILKASPNQRQANQFLYFAGDSAIQVRLVTQAPYAGLAKGAVDDLPLGLAANLPLTPANQTGALAVDETFWRDNRDKLNQRFTAWLAR